MTMAAGWKLCRVFVTRVSSEKNLIRRFSTSPGNGNGRNAAKSTHFGFETVTEEEKDERVYSVFHNVAQKYDVMNDAMSIGVHRLWKDYFVSRISPMPRSKYIDVAGGTGDIALRLWEYVKNDLEDNSSSIVEEPQSHITVCDINQAMLDVGKTKAEGLGYTSGLTWAKGNAEELPFEDDTFDVYTIAFGLRNVTHIDKAISEAYRVLRPGGRFSCLEFSEVKNPILRSLYDQYSFQVIPVLGKLIAGDWKSYQYLVESIRKFPNQEDFCEMIEEAGFNCVSYENLTFGVAAIHSGFKLEC